MDLLNKYWAQCALIITVGFQAFTVIFSYKAKSKEQKFDIYLKSKVSAFTEWHENYSSIIAYIHNSFLNVTYGKKQSSSQLDLELIPILSKWTALSARLKMYCSDTELDKLNAILKHFEVTHLYFTEIWALSERNLDIKDQNKVQQEFNKLRNVHDVLVNEFVLLQRKQFEKFF